jgi:hypothetical protein
MTRWITLGVFLLMGGIALAQGITGGGGGSTDLSAYARLDTSDQTLSGGANVTAAGLGTKTSGTVTIDCGTNPLQFLTNGGGFTLAAPAADGSCSVLVTNNGSAGTITPSGFTVGINTGDSLDTTSGHKFIIDVRRINGTAMYSIQAAQ